MMEENIWRTKLQYLLEGLQMEHIDELMDKPPVALKFIGSAMASEMEKLKTVTRSFERSRPNNHCIRSEICDMKHEGCTNTCFLYQPFVI
ncbi:MAG: hypothetical protein JW932_10155 [Deltaproteobacteria bacterium]|nr:hypothetical protein [Deltaproteobacteria bacterium]